MIGPGVTVEAGAKVTHSILLGDTVVPAGAKLESVIADVAAHIPSGKPGKPSPAPATSPCLNLPAAALKPTAKIKPWVNNAGPSPLPCGHFLPKTRATVRYNP